MPILVLGVGVGGSDLLMIRGSSIGLGDCGEGFFERVVLFWGSFKGCWLLMVPSILCSVAAHEEVKGG